MGLSPLDGAPLAGKGGWVLWCWGDPAHPDCLARCRDGLPYCEADYHAKFGIRCDGCEKYITGHVLEVGAAPVGAGFHLPREGRQGLTVLCVGARICTQSFCHPVLPPLPGDTWECIHLLQEAFPVVSSPVHG